nr:unnamed protein product [Callosobruchus chinensis]
MKRVKACIAIIFAYIAKKRKKIKNRRWVKDWILQRQKFAYVNLLDYIKEVESAGFKNYYRMESETYQELLDLVTSYIEKKSTNMREAISAHERLLSSFLDILQKLELQKYPRHGFINIIRRTSCPLGTLNFF